MTIIIDNSSPIYVNKIILSKGDDEFIVLDNEWKDLAKTKFSFEYWDGININHLTELLAHKFETTQDNSLIIKLLQLITKKENHDKDHPFRIHSNSSS